VQPPWGEKQTLVTSTLNAKAGRVILKTKKMIAVIFFMNSPQIESKNL
jgi:hypothetical protein